jgi:hypothetical protein
VAAPSLDYSATDRYCAEELLILLINFMKINKEKKMKSEQAVLSNPCLDEEEEEEDKTVGENNVDISDDLCEQLNDQLRSSSLALQVAEATDVVKDVHLITCVTYVLKNYARGNILFCKHTDGRTVSLEMLDIKNHFLDENEIN